MSTFGVGQPALIVTGFGATTNCRGRLLRPNRSLKELQMKRILLGLLLLVGFQPFAMAQGIGPTTWTNQNGSVLKVTTINGIAFRGVFVNRDPQIGCLGIPYPVTGTYFSPQVTFKVNFVKCGAVVTWRGSASGFGMSVQWVMQRGGAFTVGFDAFGRP
jgi:hypothetical protein